jgi:uncharacterized protein
MKGCVRVRVHPGARRNAIGGWLEDGTLKIEVTAVPESGRANRAVCELIAEAVGAPRQQVSVVRGETSRRKQIEIEGVDAAEIRRRIDRVREGGTRSGK